MKSRKFIERFIKDNFDLSYFDLFWETDYFLRLVDINGESLDICAFNPEEIWTSLNGVPYLKYRLIVHTPTGKELWEVINDTDNQE